MAVRILYLQVVLFGLQKKKKRLNISMKNQELIELLLRGRRSFQAGCEEVGQSAPQLGDTEGNLTRPDVAQ